MAGEWIKMRADLFTHPKVFKIADALGKDELYVVGALLAFWSWAHSHAVDGRVDGATPHLIDRATRAPGLSDALVSIDWLQIDDAGITIPRFDVHNSDSAKERTLKNERQARWRERKKNGDVDAEKSTPASTKAPTREEKRREEKSSTDVEDKSSRNSRMASKPEGVTDAVWSDFLAIRKAKRAPLTATALAGIELEAKAAGMGLAEALALCCARGWQGFKAEWVSQTGRPSGAAPAESYAERTERMHRERVAEFMGRPAEESGADIIDVTPRIKRLEG